MGAQRTLSNIRRFLFGYGLQKAQTCFTGFIFIPTHNKEG